MASPQITEHRGYLIVPVLDDETGKVDYYDVHDKWEDFDGDWTCSDPEAEFLPTKTAARAWIADHIRWHRIRNY